MKEGNSVELYRESYMVHTRGMLGCTKCPVRHMTLSRWQKFLAPQAKKYNMWMWWEICGANEWEGNKQGRKQSLAFSVLGGVQVCWSVIPELGLYYPRQDIQSLIQQDVTLENGINGASLLYMNLAQGTWGPHFTTKWMKHLDALSPPANLLQRRQPKSPGSILSACCRDHLCLPLKHLAERPSYLNLILSCRSLLIVA